jgi:hypothetical protein
MKPAAESRFPRSVSRLQVATRGKELTDHTDRCILAYAAQLVNMIIEKNFHVSGNELLY